MYFLLDTFFIGQLGGVTTHIVYPPWLSASDVVIHIDDTQPLIGIAHIMLVLKSERDKLILDSCELIN